MKKMINKPEDLVNELLEGFSLAFPDKIKLTDNRIITRATPKAEGKVALVTLGGCGHEPGLSGYVGHGILDASVPGEIFAAPAPDRCLDAIKIADRGAGVLFVVLNHAGDVLTANYTMEMARKQDLNVRMLLVHEDIASGPVEKREERRGLVGFFPVIKIAGAAAESGLSLDKVFDIAQQVERHTRTLAVAFTSATHPVTGEAIAPIAENEMVIGMGQHGEAGGSQMPMKSADETADLMLRQLIEDLGVEAGEELLVMLNGAGATTLMELFIVFRRVRQILAGKEIKVPRNRIGEFITTQEMAGFQMNITKLGGELTDFWDAPCDTPYFVVC
jgi:phosphoenolpyruvate---glycerone phosphotransferase subunit DhaK